MRKMQLWFRDGGRVTKGVTTGEARELLLLVEETCKGEFDARGVEVILRAGDVIVRAGTVVAIELGG